VSNTPGKSDRTLHFTRELTPLEIVALGHAGIAVVFATWAFGGNAPWAHLILSWWGSLSAIIILAAVFNRDQRFDGSRHELHWLWPLACFNLLVLISAAHPNFREITAGTERLLVETQAHTAWPSSARPVLALRALWLFDALYLTGFSVFFLVRLRRALRGLLLLFGANALVLSVFGTTQKLTGAKGLYFGMVHSPNPAFFASFIYHNHWGPFALLMMAASLGLVWHYARHDRGDYRDFWHSPAFVGLVLLFFLAITIPLSTSRSSTLFAIILLGFAFIHWTFWLVRQRRGHSHSALLPIIGAGLTLAIAGVIIYWLGRPIIEARFSKTQEQIAQMRAQGGIGARALLYRNTWNMARDKLWFGWGMGSYPTVFYLYNTQDSPIDHLPIYYADAHSDWLQSVAEIGLVGTILLALHGLLPLLSLRQHRLHSPLALYLFGGCLLVLLYAWIEFPFGNPAVVLVWWLCFFTGVRYVRLET
jgi:O-antigen ligase